MHRRDFLRRAPAAGALVAGCRSRTGGGPIALRLSHAMTAGPTALHAFAAAFRELAEVASGGTVEVGATSPISRYCSSAWH